MKRTRFIYEGLACDVFIPDDVRPGRLGLYLYGFPGSIGEAAPTRAFLQSGYPVVQPHYPGTYDSAGECSPSTAMEMVRILGNALKGGSLESVKDGSPIVLPHAVTTCVGHSYGCFVALRGAACLEGLRQLILLGPAVAYGPGKVGLREDGGAHVNYVRRSRPFTYRGLDPTDWAAFYAGAYDGPVGRAPDSLLEIDLRVGADDKYFDTAVLLEHASEVVKEALPGAPEARIKVVADAGHGPAGLLDDIILA